MNTMGALLSLCICNQIHTFLLLFCYIITKPFLLESTCMANYISVANSRAESEWFLSDNGANYFPQRWKWLGRGYISYYAMDS